MKHQRGALRYLWSSQSTGASRDCQAWRRPSCLLLTLLTLGSLAFAQNNTAATATTSGADANNTHASTATGLDSSNAAGLEQAWHIQTPEPVSHTPLLANGRVYFADWGGTVYAADATTGKVMWQQQVETPNTQWP